MYRHIVPHCIGNTPQFAYTIHPSARSFLSCTCVHINSTRGPVCCHSMSEMLQRSLQRRCRRLVRLLHALCKRTFPVTLLVPRTVPSGNGTHEGLQSAGLSLSAPCSALQPRTRARSAVRKRRRRFLSQVVYGITCLMSFVEVVTL